MKSDPLIAIIGAGAVGSYFGGRLAEHKHDVHFLLRSDFEAVISNGLSVTSPDGDFHISPAMLKVYNNVANMPKADIVIIALKTTANDFFGPLISPLLKEDTAIITLQNGLNNEEQLAAIFGPERIFGCLTYTGVNRIDSGCIHHMVRGTNRIGKFNGPSSERVRWLADLFTASKLPCEIIDDLRAKRWEKVVWNVPVNGLSVLLEQTISQILSTREGVELFRKITAEVALIAREAHVPLDDGIEEQLLAAAMRLGSYRTSMQIDREKGRPLEVEAILGEPLRAVSNLGCQTQHVDTLYKCVMVIDAELRGMKMHPSSPVVRR